MLEIHKEKSLSANKSFEKEIKESGEEFIEIQISRFLPILGCIFQAIIGLSILYGIFLLLAGIISYLGIEQNSKFIYTIVIIPAAFAAQKYHSSLFKSIFTRFAVSDDRILYKKGIICGDVKDVYYMDMLHVNQKIPFWSPWFDYGTIVVYSAGAYIAIDFVKNYTGVKNAIKRKVNEIKMAKLATLSHQEKQATEKYPDSVQ